MKLTHEQIMSMSNKEINDLITHEVMGYERDWTTSIAAAWEVVEKFTEVTLTKYEGMVGNWYYCRFGTCDASQEETAPLAIMKAALLIQIKED